MYKGFIKRIIDLLIALTGLILLAPIAIIIYVILFSINKGNPLFYQKRPGKNEIVFKIMKYKTMSDITDKNGNLLPDEDRLTKLGNFLRKTSLDEIPQLLNIIKGDMSLIGPRPLRVEYLPYYTQKEQLRHSVRPGITGLAQISGRNFLQWDDRLSKDIEYVENLSFKLDIYIFFKTIVKVITSKDVGINSDTGMVDLNVYRKNQI